MISAQQTVVAMMKIADAEISEKIFVLRNTIAIVITVKTLEMIIMTMNHHRHQLTQEERIITIVIRAIIIKTMTWTIVQKHIHEIAIGATTDRIELIDMIDSIDMKDMITGIDAAMSHASIVMQSKIMWQKLNRQIVRNVKDLQEKLTPANWNV